ncbi:hypothetical protein SD70_23975 [Gordoniibacillus kamchatkensis]|uniref:Uncharacterized protein n=1 Tax=Gordoniibacillus kamchatkensis TaxID=1590651 RepID=A0ABR5AD08_9BACL|nr:hypothetical protein SD70_23975 [Paenibacillus sp. VKM B-2647]
MKVATNSISQQQELLYRAERKKASQFRIQLFSGDRFAIGRMLEYNVFASVGLKMYRRDILRPTNLAEARRGRRYA